jgi:hypothetical protein
VPFKANQDRRHHIPKQRHKVTNWAAYDDRLAPAREPDRLAHRSRDCGAEGRAPGHARRPTAVLGVGDHDGADTAVFRLPLRQTEGLIASLLLLLGFDLAAPDHSTMSRRGETLPVSRPRPGSEPLHLLVDSTGLKLCGPGEWLVEKQAARTRLSWRKLHIGVDTGRIIAPP